MTLPQASSSFSIPLKGKSAEMLQKVLGYCYFKHPVKTIYYKLGEIKKLDYSHILSVELGTKKTANKAPGNDKRWR